jgi:hypothetical protein
MANLFVFPRVFEAEMAVRTDVLSLSTPPANTPPNSFPTAIRWRLHQDLGFPREPFRVFRRPNALSTKRTVLTTSPSAVAGKLVLEWGRIPLMEVRLTASPSPGASLTLQALDDRGGVIFGEVVTVASATPVRLRMPNICALQVLGNGTISSAVGFSMADFVNDANWELVEIVGLPVTQGQVPEAIYNSGLQGHPAALKPGLDAAMDRLKVGFSLYLPPPATDPSGGAAPTWPAPTPDQVLKEIRDGASSLLSMILEMLGNVDPHSLTLTQATFEREITGTGLRQPGGVISTQPSSSKLKLASLALLSAAVDCWTALALGFGTTDFPTQLTDPMSGVAAPPHGLTPAFDYMVTANYVLPLGLKLSLAAIAAPPRFSVQSATPLAAQTLRRHRPLDVDQQAGADVALTWNRLPRHIPPQGYAIAIREGGGPPKVLNQRRKDGGFIPYVPARRPDGDVNNELSALFIDLFRLQPLVGTRTDTYLVAATDIFGRWSGWTTATNAAAADPPSIPRILDVKFVLEVTAASGRSIPAALTVDFIWDWQDRSPRTIEFAGAFYSGATPPATPPPGFQRVPGGPAGSTVVVSIPAAGPLTVAGGGSAMQLAPQPGDAESRRYRLTITGFTADFTSFSRLRYAVFARASEAVNPALFSSFGAPFTAETRDPLPPSVPALAPVIHWTALPDAAGVARAHITFPPATAAAGYVVYEAREAAVRTAAGLPASTEGNLEARAVEVFTAAETPAALDAFTRVNSVLLPSPEAEVEIPGSSTSFFVYKISAMSAEQIESPLSTAVLVAVPQRITPSAPSLHARYNPVAAAVDIVVEPGPGPAPAGIALFRSNALNPDPDVDWMGPAVYPSGNTAWSVSAGLFRLSDPVTPSWRPYFYRAVAVGPDDPHHGRRAGRSRATGPVRVFIQPTTAPDLADLAQQVTSANLVQVTFRSSADIKLSPLGPHHLRVSTIGKAGGVPIEHVQAEADLPDITALTPPAPEALGQILRGARDAAGRFLYETFVPKGDDDLLVRITDPANRSTELRAPLSTAPPPGPPDLADLRAKVTLTIPGARLQVAVRSSAPVTKPPHGAFVLELIAAGPAGKKLLARAALDAIGTAPGMNKFVRSGPAPDHRFTYSYVTTVLPGSVKTVLARLTDPNNLSTQLTANIP